MNEQIVIKVGSGYMQVEEFVRNYGEQEETRLKQKSKR